MNMPNILDQLFLDRSTGRILLIISIGIFILGATWNDDNKKIIFGIGWVIFSISIIMLTLNIINIFHFIKHLRL